MATKLIVIALGFTVMGETLALADGTNQQATNSANVHAMNFDRCPYYPSPVFCREVSRAHQQDEMDHDNNGR